MGGRWKYCYRWQCPWGCPPTQSWCSSRKSYHWSSRARHPRWSWTYRIADCRSPSSLAKSTPYEGHPRRFLAPLQSAPSRAASVDLSPQQSTLSQSFRGSLPELTLCAPPEDTASGHCKLCFSDSGPRRPSLRRNLSWRPIRSCYNITASCSCCVGSRSSGRSRGWKMLREWSFGGSSLALLCGLPIL